MSGLFNNLDPARTRMLVIDMQRGFVEEGAALCVPGAAASLPAVYAAVCGAHAMDIGVIWIIREYAADGSDMEPARRADLERRGLMGLNIMVPGTTGVNSPELCQSLVRADDEPVIVKKRYSAFFGTDLHERLQADGVDTLIVIGTQTPNCVRATCVDALNRDYNVVVFSNATSSADEETQRVNLRDLANMGVEVR